MNIQTWYKKKQILKNVRQPTDFRIKEFKKYEGHKKNKCKFKNTVKDNFKTAPSFLFHSFFLLYSFNFFIYRERLLVVWS